ncbi:MAG: hypothetical protein ACYC1M_12015 [Armatimonadota bacterium]
MIYVEPGTYQLILEQTSSSESHYELTALSGVVTELSAQVRAIRLLLEQSFAVSELMRGEAQRILALHEQSAGEYLRSLDDDADAYPFKEVPAGTTIRDLPAGGRLFSFSDGTLLRVLPGSAMVYVGEDGEVTPVAQSRAGKVVLPGGMELILLHDAITVTHQSCGIEGLPSDVEPTLASDGRYSAVLPDGVRLDVLKSDRLVVISNPTGTVNVIGLHRIEGIGEEMQARSISGGAKSFRAVESTHAGMIEVDGSVHLSLASGLDLVIRFPNDNEEQEVPRS